MGRIMDYPLTEDMGGQDTFPVIVNGELKQIKKDDLKIDSGNAVYKDGNVESALDSLVSKPNMELLWSGDINSAGTTNLTKSATNYTLLLVMYGTGGGSKRGLIIEKNSTIGITQMDLDTAYMNTVYQRAITVNNTSFTTSSGLYWRTNGTSSGEFLHIFRIYGII